LCKNWIMTLVFEKNTYFGKMPFFAENRQKSQKIVVITLTPGSIPFGKRSSKWNKLLQISTIGLVNLANWATFWRVTGLGRWIFTHWVIVYFLKMKNWIPHLTLRSSLTKNCLGYFLGDICRNPSGHPVNIGYVSLGEILYQNQSSLLDLP
jgi:hypothetical protein